MFYLKRPPNKDGTCLIYLQFNFGGYKLIKSTGKAIDPNQWDDKRKLPKRTFRYYPEYRARLEKYDEAVRSAYEFLSINSNPTKEQVWAEAEKRLRRLKPLTVADYAHQFTTTRQAGSSKPASVKIYRRTADLLTEYDPKATFEALGFEYLEGFKNFLLKKKKFGSNTAAKAFSTLKTILNDATEKGLNTNLKYKTRSVSIPRRESTEVFLDEKEIMAVYWTTMPNKEKEAARDVFVLSCLTGIRFSDIGSINKQSLTVHAGIQYFTFRDIKTGHSPEIPVLPLALKILEKYQWKLPQMSNQKYNDHLKDICLLAGLDQPINVTTYPGGVRHDTTIPKYKMVSSHTARRSLICNLYLSNLPVETIKKISGHKSHSAFLSYLRLTPKDHLLVAYRSDFYKEKFK